MSSIFGGSKSRSTQSSKSVSGNNAYGYLQNQFGAGSANLFKQGQSQLSKELAGGFGAYKNKTGFDFMEKLGLNKVAGGYSGRGAFQSGAALKSLAQYENGLEKQAYESYLDNLFQATQSGLAGGQLLGSAGQFSNSTSTGTSTSKSNNGMGSFLGSIASGVAMSDRRLKTDIENLGELREGLNLYRYSYIDGTGPFIGVMADEVEKVVPEALGPEVSGYQSVDYDKLKEVV